MNSRDYIRINEIIIRMSDGSVSAGEIVECEKLLDNNRAAIEYFVDCSIDLNQCQQILQLPARAAVADKDVVAMTKTDEAILNPLLWKSLLEQEKTADAIKIEKKKAVVSGESEPHLEYSKNTRRINKTALYTAAISLAALLVMITFVRLAPLPPSEVATLTDSVNTKWLEAKDLPKKGSRLSTQRGPMLLDKGFAEILFDNQAKVVIESPAKFEIVTSDQLKLIYGRAYAKVPREALGFTICSTNSKIIDLGTEFGISAALDGTTQLHVIKGQTMLIAGDSSNKIKETVLNGSARQISGQNSAVSEIPCNTTYFAREINSKDGLIWRDSVGNVIQNSLRNNAGHHSQESVDIVTQTIHQPDFLSNIGLETAYLWNYSNTETRGAWETVKFTKDGVVFGACYDGYLGRNSIRTIQAEFGKITFDAFITMEKKDPNSAAWIGLGSGNPGSGNCPDMSFDWAVSPNAADSVFVISEKDSLKWHKQAGQTINGDFTGPAGTLDLKDKITRLVMHHDAKMHTITFSIDVGYTGIFMSDVTLGPIDVSGLYRSSPSKIYFGGDSGVVFYDLYIVAADNSSSKRL